MDIAMRGAAALLTIALPLALGVYLVRKLKAGWRLWLVGAATFVGSQVLHIPFNLAVLNPTMARLGFGAEARPGPALAAAALLLGLSAGVFEEGARWIAYRFFLRRARSWGEGVTFGAGHGGAEALLAGVGALAALVQLMALRGQDLAEVVPAAQLAAAQQQFDLYWSMPGWSFFFAAVERASALGVQMTLAVMVLQAFRRRRGWLWFVAAIGWHAAVDAAAVFAGVTTGVYAGSTRGIVVTEVLIGVMAAASLVMLFRMREPESPATLPPVPSAHTGPVAAAPTTSDRLRESRYANPDGAP